MLDIANACLERRCLIGAKMSGISIMREKSMLFASLYSILQVLAHDGRRGNLVTSIDVGL